MYGGVVEWMAGWLEILVFFLGDLHGFIFVE